MFVFVAPSHNLPSPPQPQKKPVTIVLATGPGMHNSRLAAADPRQIMHHKAILFTHQRSVQASKTNKLS